MGQPTIKDPLIKGTAIPFIICTLLLIAGVKLHAQVPAGYYDGTAGLSGDNLKTVLYNIIKDHHALSYDSVTIALRVTDEDTANTNNVICFYTGWSYLKNAFGNGTEEWNREHVWSQSHGDFGYVPNPGTDLHHLRPADASVNSAKSNRDFDEGTTEYIDGSGPTGCYIATDRWEPRASVKGDVARMIFYMATRYEGENGEPDLELVDYVFSSPNSEPLYGNLDTLLKWHQIDPVDNWERRRNDTIHYNYQHNRNPYIDHPEFAELIWGDGFPEPVDYPSDFSASNIVLSWTDATGTTLPDGYLIIKSSVGYNDIPMPLDGVPVTNDADNINVAYGVETAVFKQVVPGTYYIKIFPYRNSGSSINYKTEGEIQQLTILIN